MYLIWKKKLFIFVVQTFAESFVTNFRSGVEEEYGEKEELLDEINELLEEEEKQKEKDKVKKEKEENAAKEIRKRAMENIAPKKSKLKSVTQMYQN